MYSDYRLKSATSRRSMPREEIILPLDWDIIDTFNGFSFDMGGSVMKLIYLSKQDWKEPTDREKESRGCLRITRFARKELDQAFDFISKNVRFSRKEEGETLKIYTSGFGATEHAEQFKKELNVSVANLSEFDCFTHGFNHIVKNYPREEILQPVYKQGFEAIKLELQGMIDMMSAGLSDAMAASAWKFEDFKFPQLDGKDMDKPIADEPGFFPCAYMMCGSANGFSIVQSDGTSTLIDGNTRGGKMFMGLVSLLTGVKNYDEVMELCMRGKAGNVTVTNKTLLGDMTVIESNEDDNYAKMVDRVDETPEMNLYSFGHADGKDLSDFRKEDLARALLETIIMDVATTTHSLARLEGVKHVFFCGGFCDHELVRQIFTIEWLRRDAVMRVMNPNNKDTIQAHFLKHGQSLGTIGALLNHKTHWFKTTAENQAQ